MQLREMYIPGDKVPQGESGKYKTGAHFCEGASTQSGFNHLLILKSQCDTESLISEKEAHPDTCFAIWSGKEDLIYRAVTFLPPPLVSV